MTKKKDNTQEQLSAELVSLIKAVNDLGERSKLDPGSLYKSDLKRSIELLFERFPSMDDFLEAFLEVIQERLNQCSSHSETYEKYKILKNNIYLAYFYYTHGDRFTPDNEDEVSE